MALEEKQFELAGVTFGRATGLEIKDGGWTTGAPELRSTSANRANGNGQRFGRRLKGGATWGFSMFTNGLNEDDGYNLGRQLAEAWGALEDDLGVVESGAVLPLRYRVAGQERMVYGQPSRLTVSTDNLSLSGRIDIEADFELVAPLYFDSEQHLKTFPILPPLDLAAGLVVPFVGPFVSAPQSDTMQGQITVGGQRSTPVTVRLVAGTGPLADAQVIISGKEIRLIDEVKVGDPVVADARPWVSAISTASGGPVEVDPRVTRVSQLWLPPGEHSVIFNGSDPTSTAKLEVLWQDALSTHR